MELLDRFFGFSVFVMVFVVFVPLERLSPFHTQALLRRNWQHDLSFWVLNRPVIIVGGALMSTGALLLGRHVVPEAITMRVGALPVWVGVPLAILVADLTFYGVHRASHTFPALWQFHAVHHSIRDLDWLAGVRVHPVDQLITTISGGCVVLALGFSPATLALTSVIYLWQSHLVHSNLNILLGPLARVFVGPRFHHWHHSADILARDRNFAGQLAFIDWIFGTAHDPKEQAPTEYGVEDPVPDSWAGSLLYPVRRLAEMARGNRDAGLVPRARPDDASGVRGG